MHAWALKEIDMSIGGRGRHKKRSQNFIRPGQGVGSCEGVYVCVCVCMCRWDVYVCVCVCKVSAVSKMGPTAVCVCVCVCARAILYM
jgi:hypothetical protein